MVTDPISNFIVSIKNASDARRSYIVAPYSVLKESIAHVLMKGGYLSNVEKKGKKIVHQWNKISSFEYTTYLPRPIDSQSLEAKVKDGVITVSASVAETAKTKEIEVKVA